MIHKTKELNAVMIGSDANKALDVNYKVTADYTEQLLDFINGYGMAEVAPLLAAMRCCICAIETVLENKKDKKFAKEASDASVALCALLRRNSTLTTVAVNNNGARRRAEDENDV